MEITLIGLAFDIASWIRVKLGSSCGKQQVVSTEAVDGATEMCEEENE